MAGQKKDAQNSILRRVLDRTPLRPARLESFQPQAFNPARFAARYFNRESRVIQRLLGIGSEFSPIHQAIGRSIISRFTDFNRSFGPIQRTLLPQPEHKPRRRPQPGADLDYDGYEAEDFNYSPEPAFLEQLATPLSQNAQPDYGFQGAEALPWETPLDATPLPVARRIEFQPSNLRYLNNPQLPANLPVERSLFSPGDRSAPFVPVDPFQAPQPAQEVTGQAVNKIVPASPETLLSPADSGATGRISEFSEAAFGPVPLPLPQAQPPLSRALQRTIEATAQQTGPKGAFLNQVPNLGASPAAVARHFAVPATLARYRAVKQAADKVLLGEQSAWESEQTPAFEPTPVFPALNQSPVQRAALEAVHPPLATTQEAAANLQEARRIREETRALQEAQESAKPDSPHIPGRQTNPTTGQLAPNVEILPAQAETTQTGHVQRAAVPASATEPGQVPAARATRNVAAGQGEEVGQRNIQPELAQVPVISGRNFPETIPVRFDAAIPASLLENESLAAETPSQIQRLSATRLTGPVVTSGWANNLAALRNNPGVEARGVVARQFSEPENASESVGGVGSIVYYDQRRVRRSVAGAEAEADAAETQDRIFSLAESNTDPGGFRPQLMQGLLAEAVVPSQVGVNSRRLASPQTGPVEINRVPATPTNPEARGVESARNEATVPAGGSLPIMEQGQPDLNTRLTQPSPENPVRPSTSPAQAANQPEIYSQAAAETALPGSGPWTVQTSGLQPTALQRVFKRLDLAENDGAVFNENTGFDFANLPLSYAARPGSRPNRTGQPRFEDAGANEAVYPEVNFAGQSAREVGFEGAVSPAEASVARTYAGPDTAIPAPESLVDRSITPLPSEIVKEAAQVAGETGFANQSVSPIQAAQNILRTPTPVSGGGWTERLNQPQYFVNSLEAAWLSPENRLLVERLPGGSSALQRLMQAPGQYQAFLEKHPAESGLNLNLLSLRNNPGLSPSVARVMESAATTNDSVDGGWLSGLVLNYVQRRRSVPLVQTGFGESANDVEAGEVLSFEPSLPDSPSLSIASPAQPGQAQTEVSRFISQPTRPGFIQRAAISQANIIQNNANLETAARIQGNTAEAGLQGAAATNFTVSSDWVALLQRRFESMPVAQLSESTGQIMRFLNNDAADFAGFGAGHKTGVAPDFNYTVPPLLWRKVSNYTPQGGLPANPDGFGGDQPTISYTSPGEVLRAYEQGENYPGLPEDAAYPAQSTEKATTRQDGSARLDLPRLQQTHRLLQRIANLEKINTSLELAQRMEAAARPPGKVQNPVQPGTMPLAVPFPAAIQRQLETVTRFENLPDNRIEAAGAAEAVGGPALPEPLRMTGVPVNRPAADSRFLEIGPELFAEEDFARPAPTPESRTIEVAVPNRQNYGTPLETAAARNGSNGPNIGQGEILQPLAIQRKASTTGPGQPATYAPLAQPTLHNIIKTSVGRSLDHPVQRKMTNIFSAHFRDVRVHTGEEAAQATRHVGAEAFTLGSDIYFAPGRYQPDNQAGQALIGHELTHVIQQSNLPSLGGGRIPETSSLGQSLEHHAIANEQLLLRHLSNNHDDHNHDFQSFSSDVSGRLSFQESHSSPSYSRGTATVERSYQPVSEQNNHPPINPSHIRNESGSGPAVQRVITVDEINNTSSSGGSVDVNEIISNQENMDKLARKVYQIIRDELIIERERGFGPGNGKFF